ncbi:recombination mediator RecR [Candidatus Omnitrophota bacterium]
MAIYPDSIERLIQYLVKLPGIGRRSAERIVGYILHTPKDYVKSLVQSIYQVKQSIRLCRLCHNFSETEVCTICQNAERDRSLLCVVENPQDVMAIEKSANFNGLYHVLGGAISPLEDKSERQLEIESLLSRIKQGGVKEIILAMDADAEGEATALYLTQLLKPAKIKLSRIGMGIPSGANLEYLDSSTLASALNGRRPI